MAFIHHSTEGDGHREPRGFKIAIKANLKVLIAGSTNIHHVLRNNLVAEVARAQGYRPTV